jgi:hypothetical protein
MVGNSLKKTYAEAVKGVSIKEEKSGKEDDHLVAAAGTWNEVQSKQVKKAARKKVKKVHLVEAPSAAAPIKESNASQRKAWTLAKAEEYCSAENCTINANGNRFKCGGCKDR